MNHRLTLISLVLLAMASLSLLSGCGGGSPAVTTTTASITAVPSIYVGNLSSSGVYSVLQFARSAQGAATPIASLSLPSGFEITCLTTDSTNQIYVGGSLPVGTSYTWEVLVYAAAASGSAIPVRTIVGSSGSFLTVSELAVDSSGLLYVLTNLPAPMVAVMAASANGMATPLRTITGSATQISTGSLGIAVDPAGTLYVSNTGFAIAAGKVLAFTSTANGNAAPTRVISGGSTGFGALYGMDTDSSGNLYVLSTSLPIAPGDMTTIEEFTPTANGNVAPIRTIGGSNTGLTVSAVMRVDNSTGTIYASIDGLPVNPSVETFAATASGNATPMASFTSTVWNATGYYGIALR
jgi:hypothetical protein